jgi:chemotaxis signal transduction protein
MASLGSQRAGTPTAIERLRRAVGSGELTDQRPGVEYLLFRCGETACAVALHQLREVLPAVPAAVPLPFSPFWLLGVFPLRTELVGLVDPAPVLLNGHTQVAVPRDQRLSAVLVAGEGDVTLGLAVRAVGDIALVEPYEITRNSAADGPVATAYAYGSYRPPTGGAPHVVIDLPQLLADLLRLLTEGPADG